jgi:sugar phosphate permease
LEFSEPVSADIASLFDVGAICGNIGLGLLSDFAGIRSPFFQSSLIVGTVLTYLLSIARPKSDDISSTLTFFIGFCAMGASIVMNAIMGDVGKGLQNSGNRSVMTTIAGFNDGMGSFGSAVGQLVMGYVT